MTIVGSRDRYLVDLIAYHPTQRIKDTAIQPDTEEIKNASPNPVIVLALI